MKSMLRYCLILLILVTGFIPSAICQENNAESEEKKVEINSAVREELHRYMGYEELLARYTSLPYDVTMNTNIGGPFVDMGWLLLMFLPLILLYYIKKPILQVVWAITMLFVFLISSPAGYRANKTLTVKEVSSTIERELASKETLTTLEVIKLKLTKGANSFYQFWYDAILVNITDEGDYITYPIFFTLFAGIFFLLKNAYPKSLSHQGVLVFMLIYGYLWLILGAGVIWYGVLFIPLGIIYLVLATARNKDRFLTNAIFASSGLWLLLSISYRLGNYALPPNSPEMHIAAIHAGPLTYGLGERDEDGLMDMLFVNYRPVLSEINKNPETLVYKVGTFFHYFINQNPERVFEDNQLGNFAQYLSNHPNDSKEDLARRLKSWGFHYLILDLNVMTIDRTPDRSLVEKGKKLQDFIRGNDALELIGTDMVVLNSKGERVYNIAGRKLVQRGSFVAFRIKD